MSFDPETGAFSYRYAARNASGPTGIFVPARHYANGYDVVVSGGQVKSPPGARIFAVVNEADAPEVSVSIVAKR